MDQEPVTKTPIELGNATAGTTFRAGVVAAQSAGRVTASVTSPETLANGPSFLKSVAPSSKKGTPAISDGGGDRIASRTRRSVDPGAGVGDGDGDGVGVGVAAGESVGVGVAVGGSVGVGMAVGESVGVGVAVGDSVGVGVAVGGWVGAGEGVGLGVGWRRWCR